jgi:hypothetical protein
MALLKHWLGPFPASQAILDLSLGGRPVQFSVGDVDGDQVRVLNGRDGYLLPLCENNKVVQAYFCIFLENNRWPYLVKSGSLKPQGTNRGPLSFPQVKARDSETGLD